MLYNLYQILFDICKLNMLCNEYMCGYLGLGPVERLAPLLADVLADRLVLGQLLGGAGDLLLEFVLQLQVRQDIINL